MNGNRRLAKEGERVGKYFPSTTEILLEEICQSFGTELLQADVNPLNGTKLVRIARPVVVEHPDGKKRVLQFQYTRFSPLLSSRAVEAYNKNRTVGKRKRKVSYEKACEEIEKQHAEWDPLEEVTDPRYIKDLNMHRWGTKLYFAVYDVKDGEGIEQRLEPFLIHDEGFKFDRNLPHTHIVFHIAPYFVIRHHREDTSKIYDNVVISFPKAREDFGEDKSAAVKVHGEIGKNIRDASFLECYEFSSETSREKTMGFIQTYLKRLCLGRTL